MDRISASGLSVSGDTSRRQAYTKSAAVTSLPSDHLPSLRRWNVYVCVPSSLSVQS